jgi:hypothetical protein
MDAPFAFRSNDIQIYKSGYQKRQEVRNSRLPDIVHNAIRIPPFLTEFESMTNLKIEIMLLISLNLLSTLDTYS